MANFLRGGTRIYGTQSVAPIEEGVVTRDTSDNYLSAILKLIPAEVVSIYMAIKDSAVSHNFVPGWFLLCLGTCVVLRGYSSLPKDGAIGLRDIEVRNVLVTAIAFYLWASAISPTPVIQRVNLEPWLASALAALFAIVAPLLVPADNGAARP